jgi:hypothetical protein
MILSAEVSDTLARVDRCLSQRLPAALAIALDEAVDVLKRQPGWDQGIAIKNLNAAAKAAFPQRDIPLAREHYYAALAAMGLSSPEP